ncbi:synapse differentiation-inducing gene protein 1-like [Corythoichthys intestinalis]|uniref:synapse differentiation-inducing gene protein 1-like n=1 Tax=Corythoichthys intestinalis TaxID=161448 RepID=UPI0025A5B826|nr:proline-rich transmembrane protein 1-like [Corythoichthys intestinalis]
MDPSGPQKEWTNEKSSMGQAPPPPYNPQPGYPQPGPGFLQPASGGYPAYPNESAYPPPYGGAAYGQQQYTVGQQYPPQPATVTLQPTVFVTRSPLENPVKDYMCYSIFTLLCCCLPLGIAALVYSINTREANLSGDQMSAERCSRTARTLNHVSLGLGIGSFMLLIVYLVVLMTLF